MWIVSFRFTINDIPFFFVAKLELSLSEPFNKFTVFWVSIIYTIVTEFCEKLKVAFSDLSTTENIVAPVFLKIFPIKLIYCGSFNLVCLLRLIATSF